MGHGETCDGSDGGQHLCDQCLEIQRLREKCTRPYPEGIAWDEAWWQRKRADKAMDALVDAGLLLKEAGDLIWKHHSCNISKLPPGTECQLCKNAKIFLRIENMLETISCAGKQSRSGK
jgi:hypothetical protein